MKNQVAQPVRTDFAFERSTQTNAIVPMTEDGAKVRMRTGDFPFVRVLAQFSATISVSQEQEPAPQELAFRDELRKEIQRIETILADGTYTQEDQLHARNSLRAAGIIDENDELLPRFQPFAGEE